MSKFINKECVKKRFKFFKYRRLEIFCKNHFFIKQVSICPVGYKNSPVIFCDKHLAGTTVSNISGFVGLNDFIISCVAPLNICVALKGHLLKFHQDRRPEVFCKVQETINFL